MPADDRRHYVAWSEHTASTRQPAPLAGFDPKAPPPKTDAWHATVDANRAPEDAELADALDTPDAITITSIVGKAPHSLPSGSATAETLFRFRTGWNRLATYQSGIPRSVWPVGHQQPAAGRVRETLFDRP